MKKKGEKDKQKQKIDYIDLINKNVSDFKLVQDYSGFQYTSLNLNEKNIDVLSPLFKEFKYLEHINLNNNGIVDITHLSTLPNLTTLSVEYNNVKDMKAINLEDAWKTLRVLNLNYNKLSQLGTVPIPNLRQLSLIENKIEKIQNFGGHPKLKKLQLRRNKIASLAGLVNLPQLTHLYLAENKIKSLAGLDCPNIKFLHVRKNNIHVFQQNFPVFEFLQYLNVRENSIEKLDEIYKTKQLPNFKQIIFSQNPLISKFQFYLFDVINNNLKLSRINKINISKGIKLRAFKHAEQQWKAAQEQKKRLQNEQKLKSQELEKQQGQSA